MPRRQALQPPVTVGYIAGTTVYSMTCPYQWVPVSDTTSNAPWGCCNTLGLCRNYFKTCINQGEAPCIGTDTSACIRSLGSTLSCLSSLNGPSCVTYIKTTSADDSTPAVSYGCGATASIVPVQAYTGPGSEVTFTFDTVPQPIESSNALPVGGNIVPMSSSTSAIVSAPTTLPSGESNATLSSRTSTIIGEPNTAMTSSGTTPGLSTGETAGIVIGSVAAVAAMLTVLGLYLFRRRAGQGNSGSKNGETQQGKTTRRWPISSLRRQHSPVSRPTELSSLEDPAPISITLKGPEQASDISHSSQEADISSRPPQPHIPLPTSTHDDEGIPCDEPIHHHVLSKNAISVISERSSIDLRAHGSEYKIAIVCAIKEESDSVLNAMDEVYEHRGQDRADHNSYSLGQMGEHKIVLVYLPGSGQDAAGRSAERMKITFPAIELALVVGVCGGVPAPNKHAEIFLGDLIISTSIVTGDSGRQHPGRFERYLNTVQNPSEQLRSFLHKIGSQQSLRRVLDQTSTEITLIQDNRLRYPLQDSRVATQPALLTDELFNASYVHKHRDSCSECDKSPLIACNEATTLSCREIGCDRNQVVSRHRPALDPDNEFERKIGLHFGRIGSSNTLMRSGEHRDEAANENGLIAFEMEGAAVHKVFQTLIVKAVCDYADSHKNKSWQPYAADVAAAGAKALLALWPYDD